MKNVLYLGVLLFGTAFSAMLMADDQDEALDLLRSGNIVPLEKIIIDAKKQHGGHVLEVELSHEHGNYYYELEMLTRDGKVWEYHYDASTGQLIKSEEGD